MGDKKRGAVFTQYLKRNFDLNNVLLVADGNLVTAKELYQYCQQLTVVDPSIRCNNKVKKQIRVIGKYFYAESELKCDLIVGMHPDEATGEIVDYAIAHRIPAVIVPCCLKGKYSDQCKSDRIRWCKFLKNLLIQNGFYVYIDVLKISGANWVLKAIPI